MTNRYTHGHHESVLRSHRWRTASNSAAYLLPHLSSDLSLLDVGCGPATLTADLATRVGRVVGIDASTDVVATARAEFPGLDLVVGDFRTTALGRFDVVHAHQVLQHVDDPVGCLRAMASFTTPGGLVAARDSDYPAMFWAGGDERLQRWREIYLAVAQRNGGHADAGRHLLAWAGEAGLTDVTYTTSTWTFATPEDRAWWGGMWADRIVSSAIADQVVDYGIAGRDELADVADGWRAWASDDDAVFVIVHGELLARTPA